MHLFSVFWFFFLSSSFAESPSVACFFHLLPFPSSLTLLVREDLAPVSFIHICHVPLTVFGWGFSLLLSLLLLCMSVFFSVAVWKLNGEGTLSSKEHDQNPQGSSSHPTSPGFTRKLNTSNTILTSCVLLISRKFSSPIWNFSVNCVLWFNLDDCLPLSPHYK